MMRRLKIKYIAHLAGWLLLCLSAAALQAQLSSSVDRVLHQAVQTTPAVAVVLDVKTGRVLAATHPQEAAAMQSAPGSTLKPFFLADALEDHLIRPQSTVFCRKNLTIAGRNVACTHPQNETVFNAELALAYSCNRYFAELATRFSPEQTTNVLWHYGLIEQPRLFPSEAASAFQSPTTTEQRELFILGLQGIQITPAQLAEAYRKLALQLASVSVSTALQAVKQGLEESVQYGMAHNADVTGLSIAGKTGTASDPGQPWTHGWFAGFAPVKAPRIVVVVYLPRGNGADAAHLAQIFFRGYKETLLR